MIAIAPRAASYSTSSRIDPPRRPQEPRDDLALTRRVQPAPPPMFRRSFAAVAPARAPFLKGTLALKDGTPASIASVDLLSGGKDCDELGAFYNGLSSFSGIKGDRCSDRTPGGSSDIAHHAPRQVEIAQACVRTGGRVLALRAEVNGRSVIVGACMMDYESDGVARPHRMVTADGLRGKGIASLLKLAQLECAISDGRTRIDRLFDVEPEVLRTYARACEQLGLVLSINPRGGFHIELRPPSAPLA